MADKLTSVVVTVGDEALSNIDQLAAKLRSKGMKVEQVLPVTGVITGSVSASKIAALKKADGVLSVEEEASAQLPPSDSSLQ